MTHHEITPQEVKERARRRAHHLPVDMPHHEINGEPARILEAVANKLNERMDGYVQEAMRVAGQLDPSVQFVTPHTREAARIAAETAVRLALGIDIINDQQGQGEQ